MPDGRLSSPNHIDYSYLRDLLADSQWQQADTETTSLIRLAAEKKELDACLTTTDIENLLSLDLFFIDRLWANYSQGRFGFSIQLVLYDEVGGDIRLLAERVGWKINCPLREQQQLIFGLDAPTGHLPFNFFSLATLERKANLISVTNWINVFFSHLKASDI